MSLRTLLARGRPPTLLLALAAIALVAVPSMSVSAAGPATTRAIVTPQSVVFKVKGPTNARRSASFCRKHKRVRTIKRGAVTTYKGVVTPPFAKHFAVDIKLERCSHGRFVRVTKFAVQGKRLTGRFKLQRRAPRLIGKITFYSARAVVNGRKSNKRYFAVVR